MFNYAESTLELSIPRIGVVQSITSLTQHKNKLSVRKTLKYSIKYSESP